MQALQQPLEHGKHYHIYNRGINSEILFREKANFEYFLNLYEAHINPIAETFAWCLMNNHFHFLVKINDLDKSKSKILPSQSFSNLFNAYTKAVNKKYNRHGSLFEGPFRRKLIENNTHFQNVITYIHNNPVHHNICEHPILYPWSSYITCISDKPTKLKRKETIELFENIENFKYMHELRKYDVTIDTF